MKLPSRMLDLSVPLDNETVLDPPIMRPKIDYKTNKENAWMLLESFPGLRAEDLPDGEGWAFERGVRVAGIDAWGWDAPFVHTRKRWEETHDPAIIWEGHKAGREIPYCHMEKLCNLEQLPPFGFTVACFPHKVKAGSGGWTRAVALFD